MGKALTGELSCPVTGLVCQVNFVREKIKNHTPNLLSNNTAISVVTTDIAVLLLSRLSQQILLCCCLAGCDNRYCFVVAQQVVTTDIAVLLLSRL